MPGLLVAIYLFNEKIYVCKSSCRRDGLHSGAAEATGRFAAAVPVPNSGAFWRAKAGAQWGWEGTRETLWHRNTRAKSDTAKPIALLGPRGLSQLCPAPPMPRTPSRGSARGFPLFISPRGHSGLAPPLPSPPTAPHRAGKQPRGRSASQTPPGLPRAAGERPWYPSGGCKSHPDGIGVLAEPRWDVPAGSTGVLVAAAFGTRGSRSVRDGPVLSGMVPFSP